MAATWRRKRDHVKEEAAYESDPIWTRIKTLELNLAMLKAQAENKRLMNKVRTMNREIDDVYDSLCVIEREIALLSQCGQRENIEIIGIPTRKDAKLEETVLKVLNKIGIHIDPYHMVAVHRMKQKMGEDCPSVIVKLLN